MNNILSKKEKKEIFEFLGGLESLHGAEIDFYEKTQEAAVDSYDSKKWFIDNKKTVESWIFKITFMQPFQASFNNKTFKDMNDLKNNVAKYLDDKSDLEWFLSNNIQEVIKHIVKLKNEDK